MPAMTDKDSMLISDRPVIIVGGGRVDHGQLKALGAEFPVVAADSGADTVVEAGLTPRLVAGDFDSISSPENFPDSAVIPTPDQDQTDFAKALDLINAPLIIGLGFLGRRLDHTLATTSTLASSQSVPVVLLDRYDAVFYADAPVALDLEPGDRVSIWPVHGQGFTASTGLEWPLDGLFMQPGSVIGTSNRVRADLVDGAGVTITPGDGGSGYLVIVAAERLPAVIGAVCPEWAGEAAQLLFP
jgi:thiamine pyrophosphokinase